MSPVGRAGRESGGHIWVFGEQKMNRITAARAGYTLLERGKHSCKYLSPKFLGAFPLYDKDTKLNIAKGTTDPGVDCFDQ